MNINGIAFTITIVATDAGIDNYIVETRVGSEKPRHYAVGPGNAIGVVVSRLCDELQSDTNVPAHTLKRINEALDEVDA